MGNKTPAPTRRVAGTGAKLSRCENDGPYRSRCLTRLGNQLHADDFKPGFCLEEGELVKRRIQTPGSARRRSGDLPTLAPYGESSVDPRHGSEFQPHHWLRHEQIPGPYIQSR